MGNTNHAIGIIITPKDHPHMCGEYRIKTIDGAKSKGSPTHIWGIPYENPHISTTCEGMNE